MPAAQLDPVSPRPPRPVGWQRLINRAPLLAYRAGLGDLLNRWGLLVLTTRGRVSGRSRYAVLTYRQHGRKTYVAVGWHGADWLHNLQADPVCLLQQGRRVFSARGYRLTDASEIDRARRLFQRGTWAAPPDFAPLALVRFDPVAQPSAELTAERAAPLDTKTVAQPSAELTAEPVASQPGQLTAERAAPRNTESVAQPSGQLTAEPVASQPVQLTAERAAPLTPLPVTTGAVPLLVSAVIGLAAAGGLAVSARLRRSDSAHPTP